MFKQPKKKETEKKLQGAIKKHFEGKEKIEMIEQKVEPQEEIKEVEEYKVDTEQLEEAVEESIKEAVEQEEIKQQKEQTEEEKCEISEDVKKQFEQLESLEMQNATKQDIADLKEMIVKTRHEIADVNTAVTRREAEYINFLKLIFERLKFLKSKIGKWFLISSVVMIFAGGAIFTTIYHNWDTIEPRLNLIMGITKAGNQLAKSGG